jgi:hypothetical protein
MQRAGSKHQQCCALAEGVKGNDPTDKIGGKVTLLAAKDPSCVFPHLYTAGEAWEKPHDSINDQTAETCGNWPEVNSPPPFPPSPCPLTPQTHT